MVEQSLVIRRVSRFHSGRYSCSAVNAEGSGFSNAVQLRVMCKLKHQQIEIPNTINLSNVSRLSSFLWLSSSAGLPSRSKNSVRSC